MVCNQWRLHGVWVLGLALALAACGSNSEAEFIASAKVLLEKKDTKGAVIQLKNALQKKPDSAEARLMLGRALLEGGDPAAALVELRKAQELQTPDDKVVPDIARAMLMTGEAGKLIAQYGDVQLKDSSAAAELKTALAAAYAGQGEIEKARVTAEDALRSKPGYAPTLILLARLRAREGDIDAAFGLLEQVLAADATDERAGVFKAELTLQAKRDVDGALVAYRKVLEAHPNSIAARSASANILFQQQKLDESKAEFALLKKVAPNHPETLYMEAQLAFADKDYKGTRAIADQLLKVAPDNARVLGLAGAAEFRMKGYLQAEALLGRALKLAPDQPVTRSLLAQTYLRSGQPNKAIDILQPVLGSAKPDASVLSMAGEAYLQMGDSKRSEEAFQRALKAAPTSTQVRTSAAMAQMSRGENGAAAAALQAVAAEDKGPRADLALVGARLRQNDMPGALQAIDGLQKKMPDNPLPDLLRGRVRLAQKDAPAAAKSFEAALAKQPTYFPAVASLAALDLASGKPDEARKRFQAQLKAEPKSYQAQLALAELDARTGAPAATVQASLRAAVKLNAAEPRPHLILIASLMSTGDGKGALLAAQEASAALPDNLEITDALGRAEMAAGDHQRAVSTFKKLTGLRPTSPTFEMRLADAYMGAKDPEAAARSLKRALVLQPDLLAAKRGLATLAMLDKRPQDALVIATDLQKTKPQDPSGFALQGEIEASRKNWDVAATSYRAALQRRKDSETAIRLHMVLSAAGKGPEAERLATDWLRDNPKDVAFPYYLGDVALDRQDFVAAESYYRSVVALQPENALALNNIAWLMAKQGKPGAVAMAEKATALMPDRPALLDTLSSAQEAENQLPKAIETQKRAMALQPQDGALSLRLAKLYIKQGDKTRARTELDSLTRLGDKFAGQAEVASLLKSL